MTIVTGHGAIMDRCLRREIEVMDNPGGSTGRLAVKIKLFTGPGTRQWPRYDLADATSVKSIRSNAGHQIQVGNISRGGALLQTRERLAPGTRIQLKVMMVDGEIPLTGSVLRSSVFSPKGMPRYQAAVAFDNPLRILDDQPRPTNEASQVPVLKSPSFGPCSSDSGQSFCTPDPNGNSGLSAGFLAVSVFCAQNAALPEMFMLNDW